MSARTHDLVGIGIGPFNLGLAALADPLDLDAVFLDGRDGFAWHHGMMLEGATTQVPFLADLVTMADPTSRFSFLAWLKATGRLYPFYIRESFYPLRSEYDAYCRWVAGQLASLRWGRTVVRVEADDDVYVVRAQRADGTVETYRARHLVLGVGTQPVVPAGLRDLDGPVVHSAGYLPARDRLRAGDSITVVGSGQSAAEIYRDLLEDVDRHRYRLDWVTRSPRFFPMEYTKLTLEMTSPEYTDHFHALPVGVRDRLAREQRALSKGISGALVDDIYDTLYRKSAAGPVPTTLLTDTEVLGARWDGERFALRLRHAQLGTEHERTTAGLVLATGYAAHVPAFLDPVLDRLDLDAQGRFAVARDYSVDGGRRRVFVQNGEEHTHGVTAPDLGFGPWRSSAILEAVVGREVYPRERRIAFQEFGVPGDARPAGAAAVDGVDAGAVVGGAR
ncbi:lysine N(6)-hydroxylase/L-ornithine N(5)-oxygenase family protein [Cellulomonas fimi]|uniref:L-lysine N6-monooxygenase MbtG n=1 Tax=Cellulomonas fimi (strain ATCC 484 / DSM 20113 / JCM 1341 / CCUG 24087 / LMG 16345 / NBRC 15513 / NCIMB 8980 / NCTC 7547 / NRS-133) TaxID=590998 RepID=F4GZ62_CELFA|nr:SidA/IucD/PvdA family monooxygenase [Cellulomonas fimi]AEE47178.1 L-lysine 6-monooxygenase (NADPH) [Cellulomonas fimi ATCC 484]NNH08998.1 SidA/IucD/PvdA family monooxygenase [Cellulomonas fimi]VEH35499.1 L-lysine 6-monooxygenase [Cellulomonas fimi]